MFSINKEDVKKTLYLALEDARKTDVHPCKRKELIDYVLDNTHLTYKYILVNALASKATDGGINPLCLQASSTLVGAFDARSICHGALVRFEMKELGRALGGSNEPFLNKPARFKELSKNNAVRAGRDKKILNKLVDELPKIKDASEAYDCLVYAIQKLLRVKTKKEELIDIKLSSLDKNAADLLDYIDQLLVENFEGEVLTLVVAGLYELLLDEVSKDYKVEVHPVNQSGSSSKEISDLDIYRDGKLLVANELKDKDFTDQDVIHAAKKVGEAGQSKLNFIVGRNVIWDDASINDCVSEFLTKNIVINVIPVDQFTKTIINLIGKVDIQSYMKKMVEVAIETKFKEETIGFIVETSKRCFGIDES